MDECNLTFFKLIYFYFEGGKGVYYFPLNCEAFSFLQNINYYQQKIRQKSSNQRGRLASDER